MADNIAKMTAKQFQAQRLADMRELLANEQGRRIIWEILEQTGLMSKNSALDPALMNRNEGKRELGVELHEWVMQAAPLSFLKMLETRAQEMENIDV
jgi:hypothetical protein|tara:strand:- start:3241 stop:3531 length:291 start_codon:yes stop_codon:yes gene_type:complete